MKYTISTKHLKLSDKTLGHIEKHIEKINHMLSHLQPDISELDLLIRENKKKRLNDRNLEAFVENEMLKAKNRVNAKILSPIYFDGTIKLTLPKKPLTIHLHGTTLDEAINVGFDRLFGEIETYKGKHYTGNSEYFDHRTIRHDTSS